MDEGMVEGLIPYQPRVEKLHSGAFFEWEAAGVFPEPTTDWDVTTTEGKTEMTSRVKGRDERVVFTPTTAERKSDETFFRSGDGLGSDHTLDMLTETEMELDKDGVKFGRLSAVQTVYSWSDGKQDIVPAKELNGVVRIDTFPKKTKFKGLRRVSVKVPPEIVFTLRSAERSEKTGLSDLLGIWTCRCTAEGIRVLDTEGHVLADTAQQGDVNTAETDRIIRQMQDYAGVLFGANILDSVEQLETYLVNKAKDHIKSGP